MTAEAVREVTGQPAADRWAAELGVRLRAADALPSGGASEVGDQQISASVDADDTPCLDVPREVWLACGRAVRDMGFDFLDWLSAVDLPDADPPSLGVVLHVAMVPKLGAPDLDGVPRTATARQGRVPRLLLRTRVPAFAPELASLTGVWPGVAWHERETFEMFGIEFAGFDDGTGQGLRSLLLPEGFEGTPLRKSFVLAARASKPWPGSKEPGESESGGAPSRRKLLPPGVPDESWGPRPWPVPDGAPAAEPSAPAGGPSAPAAEPSAPAGEPIAPAGEPTSRAPGDGDG